MSSCLGIYVEPNIIKYAKVSKERDILVVDSFGIKFYDKLGDAIKQIIADTYSYKIPISINLSEESYQYFSMFSLLSKQDMKKAIETEFEAFCAGKGFNKNALQSRYVLVNDIVDKEKVKVVHISANKNSINTSLQPFSEYKVSTISPIGIAISNIANLNNKENILIINMEENTTLTTVVGNKIYSVEKLEEGSKTVLDSINIKENSYSKAYDICKNSTIYTMEGKELQDEENEYLEDIMPTLYKIASEVQEILSNSTVKIDRIYLTGTLSVVNNIDLYFQEFFKTEKCEILKPFFIKKSLKISMKDYIEVNSAIALALQGLEDYGIKEMNFMERTWKDDLNNILAKFNDKTGKGAGEDDGNKKTSVNLSKFFKFDLKESLDATERWLLRSAGGILFLIIIYSVFSMYLNYSINIKNIQVKEVEDHTLTQIALVERDIREASSKTAEYEQLTENLNNIRTQVSENKAAKKAIPNLLTNIMFSIPQGVQVTSIENASGNRVIINAQSERYEQLGYFKTVLKTQGILKSDSVVSTPGTKNGDLIKITIEGELP